MTKLTGNISKDHNYLMLDAVAHSAIQSACNELQENFSIKESEQVYSLRCELTVKLVKQAKEHYKAQVDKNGKYKKGSSFSRVKTAEQFRDWHHTFMRHWLASILVKENIASRTAMKCLANGIAINLSLP